jgi:hypothetical protein
MCKRFKNARESDRFHGFRKLEVRILEVPTSVSKIMQSLRLIENAQFQQHRPAAEAIVPYDHLDNFPVSWRKFRRINQH